MREGGLVMADLTEKHRDRLYDLEPSTRAPRDHELTLRKKEGRDEFGREITDKMRNEYEAKDREEFKQFLIHEGKDFIKEYEIIKARNPADLETSLNREFITKFDLALQAYNKYNTALQSRSKATENHPELSYDHSEAFELYNKALLEAYKASHDYEFYSPNGRCEGALALKEFRADYDWRSNGGYSREESHINALEKFLDKGADQFCVDYRKDNKLQSVSYDSHQWGDFVDKLEDLLKNQKIAQKEEEYEISLSA